MAENDHDPSSTSLPDQITALDSLLGALESPWKVAKMAIGMITQSVTPVGSTDATTDGPLGCQLAGNRTDDAPNNGSGSHSGNSTVQLSLHQAFREAIPYSEEVLLANLLSQALSASDLKPINSVADDEQDLAWANLPLATGADCSMQHAIPVRLYEYLQKNYEELGSTNDIGIDDYRSMLWLVHDLRKLEILPYLVPKELEGMSSQIPVQYTLILGSLTDEFYHINRVQIASKIRGGNIASTVALASYWLQQCWTNHPECPRPNLSSKVWPKLPNRVVDLTDYHPPPFSPESRVKVVETNGSRGPYVALSYRWPDRINWSSMLSNSTLSKLSQGIAAGELLGDVQDACTLAKGLGIQYLWVDALVSSA
jgi:hypothetical protein